MSKEIKLPSGRTLKLGLADFSDAKAVLKVMSEEMKPLRINGQDQMAQLYKDAFCFSMASKNLEDAVMKCALRSTIDKESMREELFEKEEHRADWMPAIMAVWRYAIDPFTKSLLQEYGPILAALLHESATTSTTTTTSSPSTDS